MKDEPKYAVIENHTIYHEGDERSRTNPGHGYPAYTENVSKFVPFDNIHEMNRYAERKAKLYRPQDFTLIEYRELTVKTTVSVDVS